MNAFSVLPKGKFCQYELKSEYPLIPRICLQLTRMQFDGVPVCSDHFEAYAKKQSIRTLIIERRKQQSRRREERRKK